jgi:hypothetical protein
MTNTKHPGQAAPKDAHMLAAPVKNQRKQFRSGQSTEAAAVLQSFSRRGHCRQPAPAKDAVNECSARRRRYPYHKIKPLRSAEPAPVSDAERQHPDLTPQQGSSETARMGDLTVQRQAFRPAINEHRQLVPGEDVTRTNLGEASPSSRTPWRDAILQPPKPQIPPSAEILEFAAEHEIEHEAGG